MLVRRKQSTLTRCLLTKGAVKPALSGHYNLLHKTAVKYRCLPVAGGNGWITRKSCQQKLAVQSRWPPKSVAVQNRFYCTWFYCRVVSMTSIGSLLLLSTVYVLSISCGESLLQTTGSSSIFRSTASCPLSSLFS